MNNFYNMNNIENLPTIPDKGFSEILSDYSDYILKMYKNFYRQYTYYITCLIFLLVMSAIIIGIVIANKTKPSSPCLLYNEDTLATSVCIECIQYIWSINCPKIPYTFPMGYKGFWNSSPLGMDLVKCRSGPCGIGSYRNIIVYMQFCKIDGV